MSLNKNKTLNQTGKNSGFTIVELLIVIVVIGILAAITIVAYNGVQNRAKKTSAEAIANTVRKKAETFNSIQSYYPTTAGTTATGDKVGFGDLDESKLDGGVNLIAATATLDKANGTNTVKYVTCGGSGTATTGAKVSYYDYTKPAASAVTETTVGTGC